MNWVARVSGDSKTEGNWKIKIPFCKNFVIGEYWLTFSTFHMWKKNKKQNASIKFVVVRLLLFSRDQKHLPRKFYSVNTSPRVPAYKKHSSTCFKDHAQIICCSEIEGVMYSTCFDHVQLIRCSGTLVFFVATEIAFTKRLFFVGACRAADAHDTAEKTKQDKTFTCVTTISLRHI